MPWSGWSQRCGCGEARSKTADLFLLVPNPMLPSLAGAFLLRDEPRQVVKSTAGGSPFASNDRAAPCHVRACHQCGALYACPRDET